MHCENTPGTQEAYARLTAARNCILASHKAVTPCRTPPFVSMSTGSIPLVIACVIILASVQARQPKVDLESFKTEETQGDITHVIYPRTGRLFHADYLRDNQIFRSLERTNFMRRGPFAKGVSLKRPKRDDGEVVPKKHVYVGAARIPSVETKKGVLVREKDIPSKAILVKVSSDHHKVEKRYKREIVKEGLSAQEVANVGQSHIEQTTPTVKQENTLEKNIEKISQDDLDEFNNKMSFENEITPITEEKMVQEDTAPVVRNNDTDKTLLLRDNKKESAEATVKIPEVDVGSDSQMRKTILDDSLKLYPVYRGVKYYYPLSERRLEYSPQLTVQVDMPVVSEEVQVRSAQNSTDNLEEEGMFYFIIDILSGIFLEAQPMWGSVS
ncbi:hypothetical protein J6590_000858 [Homalodisca vitripennis]|nr:hypothetical protein J6590_000858 [Homalodisca vitripennis]